MQIRGKTLFIFAVLVFSLAMAPNAHSQSTKYEIEKNRNPWIYVDISFENLDQPGQPISVGQRFRVKASCIVNLAAILGRGKKTDDVGQVLTERNIPTDTNSWSSSCDIRILQKGDQDFELSGSLQDQSVSVSLQSPTVTPFFEEVARAESTGEFFISGGAFVYSTRIPFTRSDGRVGRDSVELGNNFWEYPLFSPAAKKKSVTTPKIVELEGEEDFENDPIIQFKRESSSSYLVTVENYRPNFEVKLRATKKGSKSLTFAAKTDADGDITIRAKRNLRGFKLEIFENSKLIVSRLVTN